ncbi:MAG: ferredoxin--nitrite reductase, partial [Nitrososphaeria archaeon]|nr:ferredoxin--nitrite reductase [Nitrososphaeria archaeon]
PILAQPTSIFIRPEDAFDVVKATVEIHREHGNRESKAKARFKWLIYKWGIERFRKILEEKIGEKLESYDGPAFLSDKDHSGVQAQSQAGYHYVNIPLIGGLLSDGEMTAIARLA